MKKIIYLLLFMSTFVYSQVEVDLSNMTDDVSLGQNCSSSQTPQEFITTGDINLNGYEITLRNVILYVSGDINGDGEIETCGQSQSQMCISGDINGDVEFDGVSTDCSTLSTTNYELDDVSYTYNVDTSILEVPNVNNIVVYNLQGQKLLSSRNTTINLSYIKSRLVIIKTDKGSFKLLRQY